MTLRHSDSIISGNLYTQSHYISIHKKGEVDPLLVVELDAKNDQPLMAESNNKTHWATDLLILIPCISWTPRER
jgi:hypothetical protein